MFRDQHLAAERKHDMNQSEHPGKEEAPAEGTPKQASHYLQPDWFTKHVMNPAVNVLTRSGLSILGSRVLEHRGRKSGELHHTPVNLLRFEGDDYLVSARGDTQWVRNVKAAGGRLTLVKGRKRTAYTAVEVPPAERTQILRAYLKRWRFEVGMFFEGVGPDSTDEEIEAIAARHPVFTLAS
jgi:deazaflavin-dependent oxidoreductase (nitroreductase family)